MNLLIESILSVIFPPLCPCCGAVMVRGERLMCVGCQLKLPITGHENDYRNNSMHEKLQGVVAIENAASYFYYRRNSPQANLIHDIKYRGCPDLGREMGAEFARKLLNNGFFDGMDGLIPVPLNFWRHCKRGYNQSAYIARGISDVTGLPLINALRARRHSSQTKKDAQLRRDSSKGVYSVISGAVNGLSHILLVDDICTTGSTLYACASAIHDANPTTKISVFVLGSTSLI